jgi:hypothetical protein
MCRKALHDPNQRYLRAGMLPQSRPARICEGALSLDLRIERGLKPPADVAAVVGKDYRSIFGSSAD